MPVRDKKALVEELRRAIDLSRIDFEALARRFEKKRPTNSDLERLKAAVRAQLERMVRLNRTRADYLEKFEALIRGLQQRQPQHRRNLPRPVDAYQDADGGAGPARARASKGGGTDGFRRPDPAWTKPDRGGARRGQESHPATARKAQRTARARLEKTRSGARAGAASDRGHAR